MYGKPLESANLLLTASLLFFTSALGEFLFFDLTLTSPLGLLLLQNLQFLVDLLLIDKTRLLIRLEASLFFLLMALLGGLNINVCSGNRLASNDDDSK